MVDSRNNNAIWTADAVDASGRILQFTHGNGVVTTNSYFVDGRLNTTQANTTQAGNAGTSAVQSLSHVYDLAGNLKVRLDVLGGVTATYDYDALQRLKTESRSGGSLSSAQTIAWDYDAIGNLRSRTESGVTHSYNYNTSGAGSNKPHAVASVSGVINGLSLPSYQYDANGSLISGAGRTLAWNSFNRVQRIDAGAARLEYLYDAEHQRVQELHYQGGSLQRTTVYLNPAAGAGLFYEEETGVAGTKKKHYVSAGGATVAMITCTATPCTSTANTSTQYWHEDHLGSVSVVSNAAGAVVERLAYEPFGKRRNAGGATDAAGTLVASSTDRGYTEHEHMEEVGLINMNGRVYDPALSRFISADPNVPHPGDLQSYNRYSYVRNNPLNGDDDSGFDDWWRTDTTPASPAPTDWSFNAQPWPSSFSFGDAGLLGTGLFGDPVSAGGSGFGAKATEQSGTSSVENQTVVVQGRKGTTAGVALAGVGIGGVAIGGASLPPAAVAVLGGAALWAVCDSCRAKITEMASAGWRAVKDALGLSGADTKGTPDDPNDPDPRKKDSLKYQPTRKHEKGGWGTEMDLDKKTAQNVLDDSVQAGKQRYGWYNGKLYEFQPDNAGGWHGYPIRGNEAPVSALRDLLSRDVITRAEYTQLIRGK